MRVTCFALSFRQMLLCTAAMACLTCSSAFTYANEPDEKATPVDLNSLTLLDLGNRLETARAPRWLPDNKREISRDALLMELIRRGGRPSEQIILNRINAERVNRSAEDLELLTALCRIQRQPDPLIVVVESSRKIKASVRKPPTLQVALQNVDSQKRAINVQQGGDYRSGRLDRWRIHVWDREGNLLPEVERFSNTGGGYVGGGELKHGKKWETDLYFASYVKIRDPGIYKVQVLYHDSACIADESAKYLDQLIVIKSEPFQMTVEADPRIVIRLSQVEMDQALALVKSLNEKDPVRIISGNYDDEAQKFISPKTPQGQLISLNLKAIPALMEALGDDKLNFRKRAWLLVLLYAILPEPDLDPANYEVNPRLPIPNGVLPDYETLDRVTFIMRTTTQKSMNIAPGGRHQSGEPDAAQQRALAREWLKFGAGNLDIQISK